MHIRRRDLLDRGRTLISGIYVGHAASSFLVQQASVVAASRSVAQSTAWPGYVTTIRTEGDQRLGDGGGAHWRRVATEPAHPGKFIDRTGGCWEIFPSNGALDVRALGARTVGDATAAVQAALDIAAMHAPCRVEAIGGRYLVEEVTVPSGVVFFCDLKRLTPPTVGVERNCVRVSPGCAVVGRIEGVATNTAEVVERGIFPAVEGCHDVHLDLEVIGTTIAVQALFGSPGVAEPPRRWTGRISCQDVVGYEGGSNGYGLNGTLCDSNILLVAKNVPRHSLYLVAGASNNNFEVHDTGGGYAPVDIASFDGQPHCRNNIIKAFIYNHKANYPRLHHYAGVILGGCTNNTVEIRVTDSAPLTAAFTMQAVSAAAAPRDNHLTVTFQGEIKGGAIVECASGSGNYIQLMGRGSCSLDDATALVRIARNEGITPEQPGPYAATIESIDFDCVSGWSHAVLVAVNYAKVDVGRGAVRTRGLTAEAVRSFSFGDYVTGSVLGN